MGGRRVRAPEEEERASHQLGEGVVALYFVCYVDLSRCLSLVVDPPPLLPPPPRPPHATLQKATRLVNTHSNGMCWTHGTSAFLCLTSASTTRYSRRRHRCDWLTVRRARKGPTHWVS
jgi:hypothetical protein